MHINVFEVLSLTFENPVKFSIIAFSTLFASRMLCVCVCVCICVLHPLSSHSLVCDGSDNHSPYHYIKGQRSLYFFSFNMFKLSTIRHLYPHRYKAEQ